MPAELNKQRDHLSAGVAGTQSTLTPELLEELVQQSAALLDLQTGRLDDRAVKDRQGRGFPFFAENIRKYLKNGQIQLGDVDEGNAAHQHGNFSADSITVNRPLIESALSSWWRHTSKAAWLPPGCRPWSTPIVPTVASSTISIFMANGDEMPIRGTKEPAGVRARCSLDPRLE